MTASSKSKTITTSQKIIKIGTSKGTTLPAKDLKQLGVDVGDEVEVTVRKTSGSASDAEVLKAAQDILDRYRQDFENLAKR
jgi:antitoxin component of MazEF toxin-antitoxin module